MIDGPHVGSPLLLALLTACVGSQASAPPPELPVAPPEPFVARCREGCVRARQMMAVGIQVIEAKCEVECKKDWELPAVMRGEQLEVGRRVRLLGSLKMLPDGPAIHLSDGTEVLLVGAQPFEVQKGAWIVAVGLLRDPSAIIHVTAVGVP